jgi:cytochrome c553
MVSFAVVLLVRLYRIFTNDTSYHAIIFEIQLINKRLSMKYIIASATLLLLLGCTSEQSGSTPSNSAAEPVKKELSANVVTHTTPAVEKISTAATKAVEPAVSTEQAVVADTSVAVEQVSEAMTEAITGFDAEMNFKRKCGGCHGLNGEKSALGKSQVIKGWDAQKTIAALYGYKDGTYGAAMKALMKSQLSSFSDDELHALAEYISKQ